MQLQKSDPNLELDTQNVYHMSAKWEEYLDLSFFLLAIDRKKISDHEQKTNTLETPSYGYTTFKQFEDLDAKKNDEWKKNRNAQILLDFQGYFYRKNH